MPNDVARCHTGRYTHEQVYVVGIDRELQDLPSWFLTLTLNELSTVVRYPTLQNSFAPLGGPDEMLYNQVYPMFVSLILHTETLLEIEQV